jgi:hypothetical protein
MLHIHDLFFGFPSLAMRCKNGAFPVVTQTFPPLHPCLLHHTPYRSGFTILSPVLLQEQFVVVLLLEMILFS